MPGSAEFVEKQTARSDMKRDQSNTESLHIQTVVVKLSLCNFLDFCWLQTYHGSLKVNWKHSATTCSEVWEWFLWALSVCLNYFEICSPLKLRCRLNDSSPNFSHSQILTNWEVVETLRKAIHKFRDTFWHYVFGWPLGSRDMLVNNRNTKNLQDESQTSVLLILRVSLFDWLSDSPDPASSFPRGIVAVCTVSRNPI
jgi:hypothetical protein